MKRTRIASHRKLKKLLVEAGLDHATAVAEVEALHAGRVLVLIQSESLTEDDIAAAIDSLDQGGNRGSALLLDRAGGGSSPTPTFLKGTPMLLTRSRFLSGGVAVGLALMASGVLAGTSSAAKRPLDAPQLSPGFSKTFTSRMVNAGGLRQHVVIGGDGPPLLLVHGWPQNWYQYTQADACAGARLHRHRRRPARDGTHPEAQARVRLRGRWPTTSSR